MSSKSLVAQRAPISNLMRSLAADVRNRLALLCMHTAAVQQVVNVTSHWLLRTHRAAQDVTQSQSHHSRLLRCFKLAKLRWLQHGTAVNSLRTQRRNA